MSRIKPEVAQRRIKSFAKRFGEAHLYLAYHAAFPLTLTPNLLYGLWVNFQKDIHGQVLSIPWIAVADLLLSSLCDEVGHELYEMDLVVRNQLLEGLRSEERFGEERIEKLSDFLLEYAHKYIHSDDPDIQDFAKTQQWTALAYTQPTQAARELALAFSKLDERDKPELLRMASLTETFAQPLAQFQPLLMYAYGMGEFAGGDLKTATALFHEVLGKGNQLQVTEITLPVPKEIIQEIRYQDKATKSQEDSIIISTTTVLSYINLKIFIGVVSLAATSFPIFFTNPNFFLESLSSENINTNPPGRICDHNREIIGFGCRGEWVRQLQQRLRAINYFNGNPTGYFGEVTRNAVVRFQQDNRLPVTGAVDLVTWGRILNSPAGSIPTLPPSIITIGTRGPQVTTLQQNLQQLGFFYGNPTGFYDRSTQDAVMRFQQSYGLPMTGNVDERTSQAIFKVLKSIEK
jgi:hypothetical protein